LNTALSRSVRNLFQMGSDMVLLFRVSRLI